MNAEQSAGSDEARTESGAEPSSGQDTATGADGPVVAVNRELDRLEELDDLPIAEHVERFEAVHAALADALSGVDGV